LRRSSSVLRQKSKIVLVDSAVRAPQHRHGAQPTHLNYIPQPQAGQKSRAARCSIKHGWQTRSLTSVQSEAAPAHANRSANNRGTSIPWPPLVDPQLYPHLSRASRVLQTNAARQLGVISPSASHRAAIPCTSNFRRDCNPASSRTARSKSPWDSSIPQNSAAAKLVLVAQALLPVRVYGPRKAATPISTRSPQKSA